MMKNKETVIGWALIIVLLTGYLFYSNKKFAEDQKKRKEKQKTEQAQKAKENGSDTATAQAPAGQNNAKLSPSNEVAPVPVTDTAGGKLASEFGAFAGSATGQEQLFTLENEVLKLTLSNKGGQIKSVELKQYKTWDKKPLILFTDSTSSLGYQFFIDSNRTIDTRQFYFKPFGESFTVSGDSSKSFSMRLYAGDGRYFEETYTLKGNSYLFDYSVNLVGLNSLIPQNNTFLSLNWDDNLTSLEQNIDLERRYSALYYKYNQSDVTHLDEGKENDEFVFNAPLEWVSYKQQFFNVTLFSKGEFQRGKLSSHFDKENKLHVKDYHANLTLPYQSADKVSYSFKYFIGPNNFNMLAGLNRDVESIIKLSPDFWLFSWIRYITRFIIWVFSWLNKTHLNYGIIILLMTLILKLVLHPLTAKSIESAAKMKILTPELTALKEKYGDDQTRIGQEQMKLYQKAGVSPLGGCLPMLIQMPILMAMYYFIQNSIDFRQQSFLWAHDLSSYDSIVTFKTMLPLIGNHISLFTILMTITSVLQAVMNNQMNAMANQQPGMKYMPYVMPVMLMFMFNSFPAALTYYYLLQNLLGVGHQWVIQKFFINDEKLRKQIEENKKNPKPVSGWQKKLSDMQRDAEQRAKQRK
ncbi:MAG TPA: membrane protein insertase YidC [Chitinophagales bacterium]|nr:membrane protein insertase YidC [Chitinophagales bacterium]